MLNKNRLHFQPPNPENLQMPHVMVIDNYDSFTYNLVQAFGSLQAEITVLLNDQTNLDEIEACQPTHLCISPGPGTPDDAGISKKVIQYFAGILPILGVCLGHQCIVEVFGGTIQRAPQILHGKTSPIIHEHQSLFAELSSPFTAMRYHSLIADWKTLPNCLIPLAWTVDHELMAVQHQSLSIWGIQFHPESVLTPDGPLLLKAFLQET